MDYHSRQTLIRDLKDVLPYPLLWYDRLSDERLLALHTRYIINKVPAPKRRQPSAPSSERKTRTDRHGNVEVKLDGMDAWYRVDD